MPIRTSLTLMLVMTAVPATVAAQAQPRTSTAIDLASPAQDLASALLALSRQSGREIIFATDAVAGHRAPRLVGRFTADEAARRLVRSSGLAIRVDGDAILVVQAGDEAPPFPDAEVVVTGTRLRGGQAYAPVTTLTSTDLRRAGQTDLGEALRRLPQNFGGGQSPVIGLGAEDFGSDNLNAASAVNLRGLGADATLTLLNGHRLAYDGIVEGVDISAIPVAAIDRLEVVADGASALYGSDAVAGVVNVILRRDFRGVETSARVGAATDGGDVTQQYDAVGGSTWAGGGGVAAISYDRNSAITAGQRRFADTLDASSTLLPRIRHVAMVASAHQAIGSTIEASIDLLYSRRASRSPFPNTTLASYRVNGVDRRPTTTAVAAAPSLRIGLGPSWAATVTGTYGHDDTRYRTFSYAGGALLASFRGRYANESVSAEGTVEGPLVALAGGDVRLAAGAGYRRVSLTTYTEGGGRPRSGYSGARDSTYAFAEVGVPLIGGSNRRAGLERLSLDLAGRFEHYPAISDVFTPKIGVLYAPARAIEVRGTWGRSFKAPTLYQLFQPENAVLFGVDVFGGTGYPAGATAVYSYGGNEALQPQRATNWSAGIDLYPLSQRRLTVSATYFHTRYEDRIVTPITSVGTSLRDPLVANLILFNPSAAQIATLDAATQLGIVNYAGVPLNPATVVAIVDNRNRNVASQVIEGVDLSATWRTDLPDDVHLSLEASGTYLSSHRRLSEDQPSTAAAGRVFFPPHLRARGGGSLTSGGLAAGAYVSVSGGVEDRRFTPITHVDSQTSVDLTLGYTLPDTAGPLRRTSVQLAVLNALNDLPEPIRTAQGFLTPYDTTNYSPVGRYVSITVAKRW